ncbi:hypothetical protein J3Q64DRAFT_1808015 [Phycomyces blakesleeanus]|uniref:Uncharacterized protein n=1 Tax=Phycomyces blakesleeanus TaxID=4837 RepID=A0ABR3BA82_PHYBL
MTIYTCILNILILNNSVIRHLDKEAVWGSVMNINSKATRTQGEAKDVKFRGMIYTDDICVETNNKGIGERKWVFDDPGHCNFFYLMDKGITYKGKSTYRYTRNKKNVETKVKKFRKLRNDMKLNHIIAAKLFLSQHNSSTTTKEKIINYLQEKAKAIPAMKAYYANEGNPA